MCAPHPIDPANLLAPIPTAVPPEAEESSNTETQSHGDTDLAALADETPDGVRVAPESPALEAMNFTVFDDEPGGEYSFSVDTPFAGAAIDGWLLPSGSRNHAGKIVVHNCRGEGWRAEIDFQDIGRAVAKNLLRSLAIEMRRQYNHRGHKIRKRAIARAIARREAMKEAGE